jgi:hypothetical protein
MTGCDHPRRPGTEQRGRWLALTLILAFVLVGCTAGETGPSIGEPIGSTTANSRPPTTTTSGSGHAPATTSGQAPPTTSGKAPLTTSGQAPASTSGHTTATTSSGNSPLALDLGGPHLGSPVGNFPDELFGDVAVGTASPPHAFELRNPFDYTVTVEELPINEESFQLTQDHCTGTTLPGSGVCAFAVIFSPGGEGKAEALLGVEMTHMCTSNTYWPCSWVPPSNGIDTTKNFTREELSTGEVVFHWGAFVAELSGQGIPASPSS